MLETPSVSVPIPLSNRKSTLPTNTFQTETKCSCNTFDPSSSPPQQSSFLKKLIKRIDSYESNLSQHSSVTE